MQSYEIGGIFNHVVDSEIIFGLCSWAIVDDLSNFEGHWSIWSSVKFYASKN